MGTQLSSVTAKPMPAPPRIVIHGKGGVGKTTFGASVSGCIYMPLEEGLGVLEVPHFTRPESYDDAMNCIAELYNEDHEYKALVIDTIDKLEPLVWDHTCSEQSTDKRVYRNIEDFGYGKGYLFAEPHWIAFFRNLDLLRRKGMTIMILSHNEVRTIQDAKIGPYDSVSPKLHKRANALLYEWADLVGFLDIEKSPLEKEGARNKTMDTAQMLGGRVLYLEDTGGFEAKNRYRLPTEIRVPQDNGYAVLRAEILKAFGIDENKKAPKKGAKKEAA